MRVGAMEEADLDQQQDAFYRTVCTSKIMPVASPDQRTKQHREHWLFFPVTAGPWATPASFARSSARHPRRIC
jgi:hypothetical protein